eukprot:TRINITY_DN4961_c0_g1_i2.p1 TRINITY_DN4961_c0_g1~~TRINITY_DN4961_c0_g1_i2.p1  ORF type:complete len:680 (+),score=113.55 TRINITY_DN4961_c0_g1_i2:115-2154(+)
MAATAVGPAGVGSSMPNPFVSSSSASMTNPNPPSSSSSSSSLPGGPAASSSSTGASSASALSIGGGTAAGLMAQPGISASFVSSMDSLPPNSLYSLFDPHQQRVGQTIDPQKILSELDKGLRSSKIGEQCESIVFFAKLIAAYPFSNVVNPAILKLSDLFRVSHNFVRYCILLALQQCEMHLNKIINVEEILRRIASVLQSNDPLARAITLRVLGSMASFVAERQNIHHGIRNCFDSHYRFEVEATLFAIDRLCATSPLFAKSILPILSRSLQKLDTSLTTKLKIIRICRRLRHDVEMISEAKSLLLPLLETYPAADFVIAILNSLTALSAKSITDIAAHDVLLIEYAINDPREAVKLTALKNLKLISRVSRSQQRSELIPRLFEFLQSNPYPSIKHSTLEVILSYQPSFTQLSPYLHICRDLLFFGDDQNESSHSLTSNTVAQILTQASTKPLLSSNEQTLQAQFSENLISSLCMAEIEHSLKEESSSSCLLCLVKLTRSHPEAVSKVVDTCISLLSLQNTDEKVYISRFLNVTRCLGAIPCVVDHIALYSREIYALLDREGALLARNPKLLKYLCKALLKARQASPPSKSRVVVEELVSNCIEILRRSNSYWIIFNIAKEALCSSYHSIATSIFNELTEKVLVLVWLNSCSLSSMNVMVRNKKKRLKVKAFTSGCLP